MPSEVVKKENEINVEAKEVVEKIDTKAETKENDSQETKTDDEVHVNNKFEESEVCEDLSESENKENEEPAVEENIEILKKRADELFFDGKRHLIIKDFQAAADVLSETCSLYGTIYGEMAEECAEAYFKYGCALLELSKDEISPVGLEQKDDEEDEEISVQEESTIETDKNNVTNEEAVSISDENNKVDEKLTEIGEKLKEEKISITEEKKPNEVEDKSIEKKEKIEEEIVTDDEKTADEEIMDADKEKPDEEEIMDSDKEKPDKEEIMDADKEKPDEEDIEEDEVNDLQLAWEMFDLAKVIYKNKDTEESKLKLAEVLMKCGEVSIEGEKFEMAIQDMTESLTIRRLLLPEDSRIIAETLFQLGIAEELGGSGDRAIELLTDAATVLNQRIKTLENSTDDKATEEMAEVKSIIPEIQDRIVDIKERKRAAVSALLAAVGASANKETTMNGGASSTTKQTSNISHLVRKRPKQEEEIDGTPNKISKLEELAASKQ